MKVAAIDEGYINWRFAQGFRSIQTAETSAENYDAMHLSLSMLQL